MSVNPDGGAEYAIIGAGIAGVAAARALADAGARGTVFEKARGPGGRLARRRNEAGEFDHGTSSFAAGDAVFRHSLDAWCEAGAAQAWSGTIVTLRGEGDHAPTPGTRYVGVPGMSSLVRHLGRNLDIRYEQRVAGIERTQQGWMLTFDDGTAAGPFTNVLLTMPAPQAVPLLAPVSPELADAARAARMTPCWAAMLAFDGRVGVDFDGAHVDSPGPINWLARNSSKPGRPSTEAWVAHARADWSIEHLERSADWVADQLAGAFARLLDHHAAPVFQSAHRWRYARVDRSLGVSCLFDAGLRIGAAGDWCAGSGVDSAFHSGLAAAARMLDAGS